jgi:hypothetical protein
MKTANQPLTMLGASQIAQRWGVHRATVAQYVKEGRLVPAFGGGRGKAAKYPIAQVFAVEAIESIQPINLQPFSHDQRTNPLRVLGQITTACEAVATIHQRDAFVDLSAVEVALERLEAVIEGRDAGAVISPVYPAAMYVGAYLEDADAGEVLANMAQSGLARITSNGEALSLLSLLAVLPHGVGPAELGQIRKEVQRLRAALLAG